MEPTKAYLIETPRISDSGVLTSYSLRCYEVLARPSSSHTWGGMSLTSTGTMYTFDNGKLLKKKTKANMNNKWVREAVIRSSVDTARYGCSLYTSPELAIAAKLYTIHSAKNERLNEVQAMTTKLNSYNKYSDMLTPIMKDSPELFV